MTIYKKMAEKSLSKFIEDRKNYYKNRIAKAFDLVYNSGNFNRIEQFERIISTLATRSIQGNLEGIVSETRKEKVDKRSRLTLYQYAKCRDKGMNNEQIRERFRLDSPYQMGGFAKHYMDRKRKAQ